jgi:hypothetical protein
MSYMVVGKIRDENLPDDFVVIIKPVASVELAIHHIVSLTESFFDLKVVMVAMEFSSPAAAKTFESPVTATNTGSPKLLAPWQIVDALEGCKDLNAALSLFRQWGK